MAGGKMQQEAGSSASAAPTEHQQVLPSVADIEDASVPPLVEARASEASSKDQFISSITSKVSALLPVSNIKSKQVRGAAPSSTPRQSQRIAGVAAEFKASDLTTRTKKRVMKALDIIGENGSIDQQAEEEYARLFSEPLSDQHVQALATLFRWTLPMNADRTEGSALLA
jgi:hypothetical protein